MMKIMRMITHKQEYYYTTTYIIKYKTTNKDVHKDSGKGGRG